MRTLDERQEGCAGAACRLAPDGHVAGVAAEGCNILVNPLQRHHLVHEAQIRRILIVLAVRQMRQMEESEEADSVGDGDKDDVRVLRHQVVAVVLRVGRSANLEAATVDPHDDRLLRRSVVTPPDIQIEAVLAHRIEGGRVARCLYRAFAIVTGLIDTAVGSNIYRGLPAQVAYGLLAYKGNALIRNDVLFLLAYEGSVDTLDGQRLIVIPVGNRLILAVLRHQFFFYFIHSFILLFTVAKMIVRAHNIW